MDALAKDCGRLRFLPAEVLTHQQTANDRPGWVGLANLLAWRYNVAGPNTRMELAANARDWFFSQEAKIMDAVSVLEIPRDVLDSARISADELKVEMAIYLYARQRLSLGKARELAGMSLWEFRQLLASRRVPPHYEQSDLDEDLATLRELGRI